MSISDFVTQLEKQDVQLNIEGEHLRINAPLGIITPELRAKIAARKAEIIAYIQTLPLPARLQWLAEWNATQADTPQHLPLCTLLEAQAERTPQATAVSDEQGSISYADLDRRANRLARYLQAQGVVPEILIGISLPRSIDMVIALLAILKAGGAYLPLDPHFPSNRLAYMLEDSQAPIVITLSALAPNFSNVTALRIICLDSQAADIASFSDLPVRANIQPENIVYLIYTSGSTGFPKGVQVMQRNLVNLLFSMLQKPGISSEDIFLSITTLSFDIAGLELYLPLLCGAHLVLVSSTTAADGSRLAAAIEQSHATIMQATPTTWRMLLAAGWQGAAPLKALCGGERLTQDLADNLLQRCTSLWNLYGPTETTVWSTLCPITVSGDMLTIGRPIANTRAYILAPDGQPLPVGETGELCIGGAGVAHGYLNRPELTAEKFLPDPFAIQPGSRLYRTGDLARFLPDGRIVFVGRQDEQVKIHGIRVELGEVEANLLQHPVVDQAAVIVREDGQGDVRLAAYMTAKTSPPSTAELRAFLSHQLPEFMIPATLVFLKELPLTANGKIDRRSLIELSMVSDQPQKTYIPPRTPVESILANIWGQVLQLEQVSIHSNFFDIGGHSLLATQIISRIRTTFDIELPLQSIFSAQTVAELAAVVTHSLSERTSDEEILNLLDELER